MQKFLELTHLAAYLHSFATHFLDILHLKSLQLPKFYAQQILLLQDPSFTFFEANKMAKEIKIVEECLECGGEIRLRRAPYIGQEVICRRCDVAMEVISISPLELDVIFDEDDDYDD